jgi:hypothetical protein
MGGFRGGGSAPSSCCRLACRCPRPVAATLGRVACWGDVAFHDAVQFGDPTGQFRPVLVRDELDQPLVGATAIAL